MLKGKRALQGGNIAGSFLICLALSGAVILGLSLICAFIASRLNDPTGNLGLFSLVAMLLSAVISGVLCARIKGEGGARFSFLVALSVVLIMLLINVIICAGKVSLSAFMNY